MCKKCVSAVLCVAMLLGTVGCAAEETGYLPPATENVEQIYLEDEAVALADAPAAVPVSMVPERGTLIKANAKAEIDYSYTEDGYVMVRPIVDSGKRWKAQVKGSTTTYTYNLTPGNWAVFPLSDGSGNYQITVYENVSGNSYASVLSLRCNVTLKDEFAPFLHANQYVDYEIAVNAVAKAAELTADKLTALEKVTAIYDYVVTNITYDYDLASTVTSGYLPVLDRVMEKKSGICFDYAALMTGMLRSQGVPCKLVVGYAGTLYHAWISVWTADHGWVDNVIYFNGTAWQRMDPTFAAGGGKDSAILKYIGDGSNYTAKYFY